MNTNHSPINGTAGKRRQPARTPTTGGPPASAAWPARPLALQGTDALVSPGLRKRPKVACFAGLLFAGFMALNAAQAAGPNTVGYTESFEAYTNGFQVAGTNGWGALNPAAGTVSTNAGAIAGLAAYTNGGGAFPLPSATHSNVLQVTDEITNMVVSATGGVVVVDFMAMPSLPEWWPTGSTNWHYAFCLTNNAGTNLVIWHQYRGAVTNNQWLTLTQGPSLTNGVWTRFTVVQDYSNSMFQLRVNGGAWITDPAGWSRAGTGSPTPGGSWFYMVKTNAVMSNVRIGETVSSYLDDLVVTNRQVTWSTNGFTESTANDGAIGNGLTLGLGYDTFNGTNNEVFGADKVQVLNLPSNLSAVATYSTNTAQLAVTFAGAATNHVSAGTVSNLTIRLLDAAFALGNAADVTERARTNLTIVFRDQPVLAWSGNTNFHEAAANDGSIGTTNAVTLSGESFRFVGAFTNGSEFTTAPAVPAGLTCVVWSVNAATALVTLAGNAAYHTNANSTSFTLQFKDAAFTAVAASNITGYAASLAIAFSNQPALTWDAFNFTEPVADDGSIATTNTVTLSAEGGATFVNPQTFTAGADFTPAGVPAGLTCAVWSVDATHVKVTLVGKAEANAATDSTNFSLAFGNSMFTTVAASNITGSARNDLHIEFISANHGTLSYPDGTNFTEAAANNGSISGVLRVTLTGATFTNATYAENTQFAVSGVPQGLTCTVTRAAPDRVDVGFAGKALAHTNANSTSFTLTFRDEAFVGLTADKIDGCVTNLAIQFNDQPVVAFGPPMTFAESVTNNGSMGNTVPAVLAPANGASFKAAISAADCDAPGVPAGLGLAVIWIDATHVTLALTNRATSHTSGFNGSFGFAFKDTAFTAVSTGDMVGASTTLAVAFSNQPSLAWDAAPLAEGPANDGGMVTTNTVTLSAGASFKAGPFSAGTHYATSSVPAGLSCVVTRVDAATVKVSLAGKAVAHTAGDNTSFNLQFLDAAFDPVAAADIVNVSNTVVVAYSNPPSLTWGSTPFTEAAANDGSIGTTNTVTLSATGGATFKNVAFAGGTHFTTSGVPPGLACAVGYVDPTNVQVTLTGKANAHTSASNTSFNLQFLDQAFNTVAASNITGSATNLAIVFHDQPALAWSSTNFAEAAANDGSIATTNTVTLTDSYGAATFTSGPFAAGNQYTTSNVPAGLTCVVTYQDATHLRVSFTGNATYHTNANSTGFALRFSDAAFNGVAASNITGSVANLAVQFADPPQLTYYGDDTFTELWQGTITNLSPVRIGLAGDTFTGSVGSDFVAAHKVTVTHLPYGLTAEITKVSDTQLSVQLKGKAYYNDPANNVTNLTFQFGDTAFSGVAQAVMVTGYLKSNLKINFFNDTPFAYVVPYVEPFEPYAGGSWITVATNGWSAEYAGAGVVTATNTVGSWAHAYQGPVPVTATHAKELYVQADLQSEIHSTPGQRVYLDFSVWPAPMVDAPQVSSAMQFAFYVSTNGEFVLWHQNRTGGTTNNVLRVLTNAPAIDTNRWLRVTVCQDYSNAMFQVRLNNGAPITDAQGWTGAGGTTNGSWFYMVQTNSYMSRFRVLGVGSGYIDDLTVRTNLDNQTPVVLTLSPTVFDEATAVEGAIDNSNSNRIVLTGAIGATFAGNDGTVYDSTQFQVSNLPSNLAAVVARTSPTNLSIVLANQAVANSSKDSVSNVVVNVLDGAFNIGVANIAGAGNIIGASQTGLSILFKDGFRGSVFVFR